MSASYRSTPARRTKSSSRKAPWLYLGLVLFVALALLTVESARDAWQASVDRGRGDAIFDLVQVATPTRPTGTPGAVAWLDLQIKRFGAQLQEPQRSAYQELVSVAGNRIPELLAPLQTAMRGLPATAATDVELRFISDSQARSLGYLDTAAPTPAGSEPSSSAFEFRAQRFLSFQSAGRQQTLVVTRRHQLDGDLETDPESPSNLFLSQASPYLTQVAAALETQPIQDEVAGRPLRVVRIYAVAEDGTFLSLPLSATESEQDIRDTLRREGQEFRKYPWMPSYVSNEFFFRFDFSRPESQAFYSGLYHDIAGHGLVSTLTMPVVDQDSGFLAVAAVDLAFDIDWRQLTASIDPPQMAQLVELDPAGPAAISTDSRNWQPWSALYQALKDQERPLEPAFSQVLAKLAAHEQRNNYFVESGSLFHQVMPGEGAIALFQVSNNRWLVVFFPDLPSPLPWATASLLLILGSLLVAGVELNRRRAEAAYLKAENELEEKENLLNSMRVPLAVVDPNSDAVVFGNQAAGTLGLEPGRRVGDLVPAGKARDHYDRMQQSGRETRRAYGVPLNLRNSEGEEESRHVVVRSVAVVAPIETLNADEHHRLGLFFPLEPEADLALYSQELEDQCRNDERRRLAGLLTHGVDSLARVLSYRLQSRSETGGEAEADERRFIGWLSSYVERRLVVTAWLLDHWSDAPPLPQETTAEAAQVAATLEHFQQIFAFVRSRPELRSRLHWNNGVLAQPVDDRDHGEAKDVFAVHFHWPEHYLFTCPVRGGVGLFLEEVLVNALRHGRPGSRPELRVDLDPVRRELCWQVENSVVEAANRALDDLEPYGGRRLLERLAHLFGWTDLLFERRRDRFHVSWRIRVSERAAPGDTE